MDNTAEIQKKEALRAYVLKAIAQGGAYTDEEIEEMFRAEIELKNL